MKESTRLARNAQRLSELHTVFAARVHNVIATQQKGRPEKSSRQELIRTP